MTISEDEKISLIKSVNFINEERGACETGTRRDKQTEAAVTLLSCYGKYFTNAPGDNLLRYFLAISASFLL